MTKGVNINESLALCLVHMASSQALASNITVTTNSYCYYFHELVP